jgi:hypothetical protein
MVDPEPGSDEQVLTRAYTVRIKSVLFEAVLTSKRIILIDKIKDHHPQKNILLSTIKEVKLGENATREQVITFTLLTNTGDTRQMVLTVDRQIAGDSGGEANEWVKALKKHAPKGVSYPVDMTMGTQVPGQSRQEQTGNHGKIKEIEIARPITDQDRHQISVSKTFETTSRIQNIVWRDEMADSAAAGPIAPTPLPPNRKGRTIEQSIHSIGSLIEDPVARTEAAPAVPKPLSGHPAAPPVEKTLAAGGTRARGAKPVPAVPSIPHLHSVPAAPRKKRSRILAAAVIIIVILAVAAGGFTLMKDLQKTTVVPPETTPQPTAVTTVPTPMPTPVVTAVTPEPVPQTTQVLIPQTGVWVEITYDKNYAGWVGMPNVEQEITDTGDHIYQIFTTDGTVAASLQKTDDSADELKVSVYRDGTTLKTVSTTAPSGVIDLQLSLATPAPTATPPLTPLPAMRRTSNSTTKVNTLNINLSSRTG